MPAQTPSVISFGLYVECRLEPQGNVRTGVMPVEFAPLQLWENTVRYARRSAFILAPNPYGPTPILRARFNDAVFYSPARKYLFASNEKVANSTMRTTFQQLEAGSVLPPYYKRFKRWTGPLLQPSDVDDFPAILSNSVVYKFCVVRHPYARLISCYRNKFDPAGRGRAYPRLMRQLGFNPMRDEITFEKFVRAISNQNQYDMNPHWRPQFYNVFMDMIDYDEVIPYNAFSRRMSALLRKFHPEVSVDEMPTSMNQHGTNSNDLIGDYFNPDLKKCVQTIYAVDFEKLDFGH